MVEITLEQEQDKLLKEIIALYGEPKVSKLEQIKRKIIHHFKRGKIHG